MSSRPTVKAEYCVDAESAYVKSHEGNEIREIAYPGVRIEVEFKIGDHEVALRFLEQAVADVRAQIQETA